MRIPAVLIAAAALVLAGMAAANASPAGNGTCYGGEMSSAVYSNLTVIGNCSLGDGAQVRVLNNVSIAPNADLDATVNSTSRLKIGNNVSAGRGAQFEIGCTVYHPCQDGQAKPPEADSVGNNVALNGVFNAAFNGVTIGGNLTSVGGGAGSPAYGFIPFSVKDDTIKGNLSVTNLNTVWFGVIRSTIRGSVYLSHDFGWDPDSNEVVANTVGGNLVCTYNSPPAQFGDAAGPIYPSDYGWNYVRGITSGECTRLVYSASRQR